MENLNTRTDEEILDLIFPFLAPENFETSKIVQFLNDGYSAKIDSLLTAKEISKYITEKGKFVSLLKQCEFLKISDDNETITYDISDDFTAYSILNIPTKMSKEEVKDKIELINLKYERLYKSSFYWILVTHDKETNICVVNVLRELMFNDIKVKYDIRNKNTVLKAISNHQYQREAKNLGIHKNSYDKTEKNSNKIEDQKSDKDSDAFSWRKGSGNAGQYYEGNE